MKPIILLSCLLGCTVSALGQVTPTTQDRSVSAGGTFISQTHTAPGFGDFNDTVTNFEPQFGYGGEASQHSTISSMLLSANGTVFAMDGLQGFSGFANSRFSAEFDVVNSTDFHLTGSWHVDYDFFSQNPTATFTFERTTPSPFVYHSSQFFADVTHGVAIRDGAADISGTLIAGHYHLEIHTDMRVGASPGIYSGNGNYSMQLIVPAPSSAMLLAVFGIGPSRRRRVR